MKTVEK